MTNFNFKKLTFVITSKNKILEIPYCTWSFLVIRSFYWHQNICPCDLGHCWNWPLSGALCFTNTSCISIWFANKSLRNPESSTMQEASNFQTNFITSSSPNRNSSKSEKKNLDGNSEIYLYIGKYRISRILSESKFCVVS